MFFGVGVLEAVPFIAIGLSFYILLVVVRLPATSRAPRQEDFAHMFLDDRRDAGRIQLINFAIFFAVLNLVFCGR